MEKDYVPIALYNCKRRFYLLYVREKADVLAECEYIALLAQSKGLSANSEEYLKLAYQELKRLAHEFELKRDKTGLHYRFSELLDEISNSYNFLELSITLEKANEILDRIEKEKNLKKYRHAINRLNLLIQELKEHLGNL